MRSLLGILLIVISCKPSQSYLMSTQAHLRAVERRDHQKCVSQGIDFGKWNEVSTQLYWRCRYSLAQDKIIDNAINAADIENNAMIKKISSKILKNLKRSKQAILADMEDDIDVFDHSKCLSLGFSLDSGDQIKDREYYQCRKKLVHERNPPSPAITGSYEASILPKKKFDNYLKSAKQNKITNSQVKFTKNMITKYPACQNVNVKSKLFNECIQAQETAMKCIDEISLFKSKKQLDDKVYCQQQAFIQFPDNYEMTKNKSADEIQKILEKQRREEIKRQEKQEEERINRTLQFFQEQGVFYEDMILHDKQNVEDKQKQQEELMKKIQILSLREEFIIKCNEMMEQKLPTYIKEEIKKCEVISDNWGKENLLDFR